MCYQNRTYHVSSTRPFADPLQGNDLFPLAALLKSHLALAETLAVDENGRKLGFGNESFSGGFVAWYTDTNQTRDSHICFIDGIECWADEALMGGIVIRVYDEQMKLWCPKVLN